MFSGEVGLREGALLHLDIAGFGKPVQASARRIPVALKDPLEEELGRLQGLAVITREDGPVD